MKADVNATFIVYNEKAKSKDGLDLNYESLQQSIVSQLCPNFSSHLTSIGHSNIEYLVEMYEFESDLITQNQKRLNLVNAKKQGATYVKTISSTEISKVL